MTGYGLYYCMGGFSFKIFLELWDDDGSYDCYQSDAMRSTNMNYNGTDQKTNTPAWEQTYIFTKINIRLDNQKLSEEKILIRIDFW